MSTVRGRTNRPSVLILVENLPVPFDRRVWQEAIALRDAGYEVVVICPQMRGYTSPSEVLDGIQIYRHWISEEAGDFLHFFREYATALWGEIRLAWKAWRRHRFDVIHLCNPPDILFLVALPFKLFGVKIVFDVHDAGPEMFEAKFGEKWALIWGVRLAERLTYAAADVVLATNESVRTIATGRGHCSPKDVFVVRTAPAIDRINSRMNPELRKSRKYLVGYVGVMGSADGIHYMIDATAHIVFTADRRDIQFLFIGTGPEYDHLVKQRDDLGLTEFIDMPGQVSDEFLFSALRTIDAGISSDPINTYNHHCTMNKVLEYMAFGLPQVLFDLREGRASAGDSAVYVDQSSAVRLGDALLRLLEDEEGRKRMGRIGRERIEGELSWEKSVEQLEMAYKRVLSPSEARV